MNCGQKEKCRNHGPEPYVTNISKQALDNSDFRVALWTGDCLQMTLMCIPVCGDIGVEIHEDTDQLIRIEYGDACVMMGKNKNLQDFCRNMCCGDAVFVPAGTWHNVINTGKDVLKVSSVYAPPHHKRNTIQCTKNKY